MPETLSPTLVLGAGAIGTLLGARLALAGCPVTLVGRARLRDAIALEGLTLQIGEEVRHVPSLRVATSVAEALAEAPPFGRVLLTTKAQDVPGALQELRAASAEPPPVACFQNGVGSEEQAAEILGPGRVIAATLTIPAEFVAPARLATRAKGGVGLALWADAGGEAEAELAVLAGALGTAGLPVRRYAQAQALKWSKLVLNMIGNATSALLGWPPARTMADPRLYDVELDALGEALAVIEAQGLRPVPLPGYPVPLQMALLRHVPRPLTRPLMRRMVEGGRGGKMPSLYLDLVAGRPESEIDVYNGAVVRHGERLGVPTPVNHALTRLLQQLVAGTLPPHRFHHDPAALLGAMG